MQPIYQVTGKVLTDLLTKETKRKIKFLKSLQIKARLIDANIDEVFHTDDSWKNQVNVAGVTFKKGHSPDKKFWRKHNYHKNLWIPRKVTKEQKAFHQSFWNIFESASFFSDEELLKKLAYAPEKSIEEDTRRRKIWSTAIAIGYKKEAGDYTFFFSAYSGYKPPRGVKEILISEYNKLLGR